MAYRYGIPGFFEDVEVKGNDIKEPGFLGKTLYVVKGNEIREPGFLGKTILVIKDGKIKEPRFLGKTLFYIDETGAVKEPKIFGRTVGSFPLFPGMGPSRATKQEMSGHSEERKYESESRKERPRRKVEAVVLENDDGSTTYQYEGVGSVTVSIGEEPTAEEAFMKPYNEVFAYAMFMKKYSVCKHPSQMQESEYAHWQFMACGVKNLNKLHKELFDKGYFRNANAKEKLSIYKAPQVKDVANQLGISSSGKKDDVVLRVFESATIEQVNEIIKDDVYAISIKGQEFLDSNKLEIEYYFENTDPDITLDEYIKKRGTLSTFDLKWQSCLKALKEDDEQYGRNIHYNMYSLLEAEGKKEQALRYLLMVLRNDMSGVIAYKAIRQFPDKNEFRGKQYAHIYFAPGLITDIKNHMEFYDPSMIDDVYSQKLPLDASNPELMKQVIKSIFDGTLKQDEVKKQLDENFEIESAKF